MSSLTNYIYISRTKLAAYLPQLMEDRRFRTDGQKLSAELGFNFGLLSGKLTSTQAPMESAVATVRTVAAYIQKNLTVGSLESQRDWIYGELGMRHIQIGKNDQIFAMVGKAGEVTILLVGSMSNTNVSSPAPQQVFANYSHFRDIEDALMKSYVDRFESNDENTFQFLVGFNESKNVNGSELKNYELASNVIDIFEAANRTPIRVTFLARRLFRGSNSAGKAVGIYSPLYVTQE